MQEGLGDRRGGGRAAASACSSEAHSTSGDAACGTRVMWGGSEAGRVHAAVQQPAVQPAPCPCPVPSALFVFAASQHAPPILIASHRHCKRVVCMSLVLERSRAAGAARRRGTPTCLQPAGGTAVHATALLQQGQGLWASGSACSRRTCRRCEICCKQGLPLALALIHTLLCSPGCCLPACPLPCVCAVPLQAWTSTSCWSGQATAWRAAAAPWRAWVCSTA